LKRETLKALNAARAAGRPVVVATDTATGDARLIEPTASRGDPLRETAMTALQRDQGGVIEVAGKTYFLNVFNAPLALIIVGAVHIAQPLSRMASIAGYGVTVIDPRTAFATSERFPGLTLFTDWPDEAMAKIKLGRRSAIVALTHDPKLDDPALASALNSDAFYIGALGSKKTHAARLARLRERGFTSDQLARIHGPVGLSIGALSPAEIAISILGQMTATLRQKEPA
jgi:xanthine dehydrogenase accessory factor